MAFSLPALPYDYTALEPYIDSQTMTIHHTKHHQTYINNINGAMDTNEELKGKSLEELCMSAATVSPGLNGMVRNNGGACLLLLFQLPLVLAASTPFWGFAGGHWNHTFFWQCMAAPGSNNGPNDVVSAWIISSSHAAPCPHNSRGFASHGVLTPQGLLVAAQGQDR